MLLVLSRFLLTSKLSCICLSPLSFHAQAGDLHLGDARITLQLVLAVSRTKCMDLARTAWPSLAAAIALLAARDADRLEARARCGFSHRCCPSEARPCFNCYCTLTCFSSGLRTGRRSHCSWAWRRLTTNHSCVCRCLSNHVITCAVVAVCRE